MEDVVGVQPAEELGHGVDTQVGGVVALGGVVVDGRAVGDLQQ